MPQEQPSRRQVLNAIERIPSLADLLSTHDDHFNYELDLEVVVYGRNYSGKKVGPYLRLLTYEPGEVIVREGDWGGNTFFMIVEGQADVFVESDGGPPLKVAELPTETQFGEMSVLAGVPRNATVKAPEHQPVQVLEIQRPALRLLRKLPKFGEILDRTYRTHGRNATIQDLKAFSGLHADRIPELQRISQFRVFAKNHVLVREGFPVDILYIVKEGWLRRTSRGAPGSESGSGQDILGRGYCLGLDGLLKNEKWPYSVTVLGRTEILEISIFKLRKDLDLRSELAQALAPYEPAPLGRVAKGKPRSDSRVLAAQEQLIDTGLVDASNLLVMDMDLCVRCGNCSLACHTMHGRSRLVRRGIHVERPRKPLHGSIQSLLSPAVCLHCKDPECLTGCPTGAIGRFSMGQIDINPSTCIGCGDCATQCPYNAISMIPKRPARDGGASGGPAWWRNWLRIQADPLPAPVTETDDLQAVKCNLCENTPLNPPGGSRPAYSCEENCPTGALVRVDPSSYFAEIGQIQGLLLRDKTHAAGRNIHRSDPLRTTLHAVGTGLTLALTAGTAWAMIRFGLGAQLWGFLTMRWITGLVGLVGIVGVMTYPIRRQRYKTRSGPLRYWLLVHTYLGVVAAIMIFLHGGTDSGGLLTRVLMYTYDMVILTGLFGMACYWGVPRMLTAIEGSPLLLEDLQARRRELQSELATLASPSAGPAGRLIRETILPRFISLGYLLRQYVKREPLESLLQAARDEYGSESRTLPADADRENLSRAVNAAATLRRVDALIYLHRLLRVWLPPHVIFTSLMLALMLVHIIQVIYFA